MWVSRDGSREVDYLEYKRQSIIDCLLTPLGSRVTEKNYGSELNLLIDSPLIDPRDIRAEVSRSIRRSIGDYEIKKIEPTIGELGEVTIEIQGQVPSVRRNLNFGFNYVR